MNDIAEWVACIVIVLILFFLFNGDPDVWDMLHARAMEYLK